MLNEALRVNSGLSYGAGCQLQRVRLPGAIIITTYTKTESTEKAIDMALGVLKQLSEKGITAEQLASVKPTSKGRSRRSSSRPPINFPMFWPTWNSMD